MDNFVNPIALITLTHKLVTNEMVIIFQIRSVIIVIITELL